MPRPPRIQFPGACYHIIVRGNNKDAIFLSDDDRSRYLHLLRKYKASFELKIYAYCLMSNHVHLCLETPQGNLSKLMQELNTAYTKYFNIKHKRVGHVFQGRYKAFLVEKDSYLVELSRYIHLNPINAGIKEKPWRYAWSSCKDYVQVEDKSRTGELVDADFVLSQFAKHRLKQSVLYLRFLKDRMKDSAEMVLPVSKGVFIAGDEFIQLVRGDGERENGKKKALGADLEAILKGVCQEYGVEIGEILGGGRHKHRGLVAARREAIKRIRQEKGWGEVRLSRLFGLKPGNIWRIF